MTHRVRQLDPKDPKDPSYQSESRTLRTLRVRLSFINHSNRYKNFVLHNILNDRPNRNNCLYYVG